MAHPPIFWSAKRRWWPAAWLFAASIALFPVTGRCDIAIPVDNPNARGQVDRFEAFDVVCNQPLPLLVLAGRTSDTITVCGGLDQAGEIRIRYQGEPEWTDYPELHSWSQIELPPRPRARLRRKPSTDDD